MRVNSFCLTCLIGMQEAQIHEYADEEKKIRFMREILSFLSSCDPELSAPALVQPLSGIYEKYWGKAESLEKSKKEFNDFLLSMETELEERIRSHEDPLQTALCYARTGNYIDFASVRDISKEKLLELFEGQEERPLEGAEYDCFLKELSHASKLVYLLDNCGEAVLDKIVLKILKEQYPALEITAVVRGAAVVNDVDLEAARYIGLDKIVPVMGNGSTIAGTDLMSVSAQVKEKLKTADVIVSKGQGNFETLHGCGLNIYYLFLCKCEWFMKKFRAKRLEGMFVNERRISE